MFQRRAITQAQRWDFDAHEHRTRLRRLDKFRAAILSDPATPPPATSSTGDQRANGDGCERERALVPSDGSDTLARRSPPLLLDLSPEREGRASRAVQRRRTAAAEAVKGANRALEDLRDWKAGILAERKAVTAFLRELDPCLAFVAGAACNGDHDGDAEAARSTKSMMGCDADIVVTDPAYLAAEAAAHAGRDISREECVTMGRYGSWAATGSWTAAGVTSSPTPSADEGASSGGGAEGGDDDGGGDRRDRSWGDGRGRLFADACARMDPSLATLLAATSTARSRGRLDGALETLREHVKATLIDLMDLETSIPGGGASTSDDDDGEVSSRGIGDVGPSGDGAEAQPLSVALTSVDAGALDVKVAGLLRRLAGGGRTVAGVDADRNSDEKEEGSGSSRDGQGIPPSLADLYGNGLGHAATMSEVEVDTAESRAAIAIRAAVAAAAGPFLWALDDAYQVRAVNACWGRFSEPLIYQSQICLL